MKSGGNRFLLRLTASLKRNVGTPYARQIAVEDDFLTADFADQVVNSLIRMR